MKIPDNVKDSLNNSLKARRLVLGTSSTDGIPNAVPVGIMRYHEDGETLIFVDNFMLKTRKNLESNPWATITCWDMEEKEGKLVTKSGFQLKGKVRIEDKGQLYEKIRAEIKAINPAHPAKALVLIKVQDVFDVKSGPNAGKRVS